MASKLFFVFDVESAGLHGAGFAFGYTLVDDEGVEHASGGYRTAPSWEGVADVDQAWVERNVHVDGLTAVDTALELRTVFWNLLQGTKTASLPVLIVCDCPWPVEARFLAQCVDDDRSRYWDGPYPLIDVASVRMAIGSDPLATEERRPGELPEHNPLADARQSARLLIEALKVEGAVP